MVNNICHFADPPLSSIAASSDHDSGVFLIVTCCLVEPVAAGGMKVNEMAEKTLKKFTTGFEGCISSLTLSATHHVQLMDDVMDGENVRECPVRASRR